MYDIATPALFTLLAIYGVFLVAGLVALVAGGTQLVTTLRGERRVRVARHQTIGAYYFNLARSH